MLYRKRLSISEAKKKDLLNLLSTRVIPSQYATFSAELPSRTNVLNCLAELSADEVEDDYQELSLHNVDNEEEEQTLSTYQVATENVSSAIDKTGKAVTKRVRGTVSSKDQMGKVRGATRE